MTRFRLHTATLVAPSVPTATRSSTGGAPKPDGSSPGETIAVSGTDDEATGAYALEWASQIVGGPFDGVTGVWHLAGAFETG